MEKRLIDTNGWGLVLDTIGAEKAEFSFLNKENRVRHEKFSANGIEWSEVRKLRETFKSEHPFIDAEGRPFVLFIYDQAAANWRDSDREYKYHFCWCSTLETMQDFGRRGRYKPKYDVDNNTFTVNRGNSDELREMNVCKNCLRKMDFKGYGHTTYQKKTLIYSEFDIAYFFSLKLPQDLLKPTHPFHTGKYTSDWKQVREKIIMERGGKCETCGTVNHLQVHHINGIKDDNSSSNLKVLCYTHHSEQPMHGHMRQL
ncbi:HNH endonuclease [Candidatus Kaiserbacteria bacterium]|nr:HNH endonuclease [Candidatus Kaiserbacteria bacterium]